MRVLLVGPAADRVRVRAALEHGGVEIVDEFATLTSAERSSAHFDAIVLTTNTEPPSNPGGRATGNRDIEADGELVEPLTTREREVLDLLAEGLPNKAIAARLGISDQTVKFHVASICGKLGAANRTEAVRRAFGRGLITL
jgi:DNA-binding NarL/FixJ family response regulator